MVVGVCVFGFFEWGGQVHATWPWLAWNLQSPCLGLSVAGITGLCQHAQLMTFDCKLEDSSIILYVRYNLNKLPELGSQENRYFKLRLFQKKKLSHNWIVLYVF
jgi:hypothetical protein